MFFGYTPQKMTKLLNESESMHCCVNFSQNGADIAPEKSDFLSFLVKMKQISLQKMRTKNKTAFLSAQHAADNLRQKFLLIYLRCLYLF